MRERHAAPPVAPAHLLPLLRYACVPLRQAAAVTAPPVKWSEPSPVAAINAGPLWQQQQLQQDDPDDTLRLPGPPPPRAALRTPPSGDLRHLSQRGSSGRASAQAETARKWEFVAPEAAAIPRPLSHRQKRARGWEEMLRGAAKKDADLAEVAVDIDHARKALPEQSEFDRLLVLRREGAAHALPILERPMDPAAALAAAAAAAAAGDDAQAERLEGRARSPVDDASLTDWGWWLQARGSPTRRPEVWVEHRIAPALSDGPLADPDEDPQRAAARVPHPPAAPAPWLCKGRERPPLVAPPPPTAVPLEQRMAARDAALPLISPSSMAADAPQTPSEDAPAEDSPAARASRADSASRRSGGSGRSQGSRGSGGSAQGEELFAAARTVTLLVGDVGEAVRRRSRTNSEVPYSPTVQARGKRGSMANATGPVRKGSAVRLGGVRVLRPGDEVAHAVLNPHALHIRDGRADAGRSAFKGARASECRARAHTAAPRAAFAAAVTAAATALLTGVPAAPRGRVRVGSPRPPGAPRSGWDKAEKRGYVPGRPLRGPPPPPLRPREPSQSAPPPRRGSVAPAAGSRPTTGTAAAVRSSVRRSTAAPLLPAAQQGFDAASRVILQHVGEDDPQMATLLAADFQRLHEERQSEALPSYCTFHPLTTVREAAAEETRLVASYFNSIALPLRRLKRESSGGRRRQRRSAGRRQRSTAAAECPAESDLVAAVKEQYMTLFRQKH
eukprot:TRINITY_DN8291_c7_g2_i1.p1 TRINITY_DN8291_c7_g2~~TRINITY_DN8291_c7_g2_i1.p1  ORF type:complete len:769 (+),score=157.90 TRINITY_DN8291_c7_g2_i1:115-2307(+)